MGRALGQALGRSSRLTHLDLGFNGLGLADCEALGRLLRGNQRLMGLHMSGNPGGGLDGWGYVTPGQPCVDSTAVAHVMTRVLSSVFGRVKGSDTWATRWVGLASVGRATGGVSWVGA
jgi:hypothetical protein